MMDCHVYPTWAEAETAGWSLSGRHVSHPKDRVVIFNTPIEYLRGLRFDRTIVYGMMAHMPQEFLRELMVVSNRVELSTDQLRLS